MKETREFSAWNADVAASLVREFEGLRLDAYLCPANIPTIGYGHTGGVQLGMQISKEKAEQLLSEDLCRFQHEVTKLVHVPVTEGQFIAILDFVFNLGVFKFSGSTLLRKINLSDFVGAAREFPRWKYSNAKVLPGLVKRRAREKELFES